MVADDPAPERAGSLGSARQATSACQHGVEDQTVSQGLTQLSGGRGGGTPRLH